MQTERVLSFLFECGCELVLMRRAAEAHTIFRGNGFFLRARFGFARASQIYNLGHRPLPRPIPRHIGILRSVCVNGTNISDYNHQRK